ncbi:terminase small subunit [Roseomonas chloroacetimidivorans]|uniref:terminase small subunit n=1 Tax=Roseomonas chloroacetimidivorans TaxID=1766656 RepID=UPI003C75D436
MALTDQKRRFVEEYLVDLNATQAAIRAGYAPKNADANAHRLLADPEVAAAIAEAQAARSRRTEITQDRVLSELAALAHLDPAEIVSVEVKEPKDIAKLPEHVRRAILGWSWDRNGNFVLKLSDKRGALELLGRHLGMWRDKVELTGKDGGPVEVEDARDRIARRLARLAPASTEGGGPS